MGRHGPGGQEILQPLECTSLPLWDKLRLSSLCGPCGSKEGPSVEKEVMFWEKLVSRHHHGKGTGKGNSTATAQPVQAREDRIYLGHELLDAKEHFFLWPNDSL